MLYPYIPTKHVAILIHGTILNWVKYLRICVHPIINLLTEGGLDILIRFTQTIRLVVVNLEYTTGVVLNPYSFLGMV